jgi:isopentenyl phosphate kinase
MDEVSRLLSLGFVVVMHGDGGLDQGEKGIGIVSGDRICEAMCKYYKPKRLVFISDVDGFLTAPPSLGGQVIPEIKVSINGNEKEDLQHLRHYQTDMPAHDTTGGILAKVASCMKVARFGVEAWIVGSGSSSAVQACTSLPVEFGTRIYCPMNEPAGN